MLVEASGRSQIVLVSHSDRLIASLRKSWNLHEITLSKVLGETRVEDRDAPRWVWPKR